MLMKKNTTLFHFLCNNSLRRFANKNSCTEKNTITAMNINKRWILMPLMVFAFLFTNGNAWGQNTVTYVLQDANGQTIESHSISAGLDYPGVGPEHAYLHDIGRAEYRAINDDAAMAAFELLCKTEGIIPAIETAHALAGALVIGKELGPKANLLINLSGRGDKDVQTAAEYFGIPL